MLRKFILGIAAMTFVASSTVPAAFADFRICNRSDLHADASVGYYDPDLGWSARGWFNLPSGGCLTVHRGDLTSRINYVYTEDGIGGFWGPRDNAQTGGFFCISSSKYFTHNSNYMVGRDTIDCEAAGLKAKQFSRVDTRGSADFTYNLLGRADDAPRPIITGPAPSAPLPRPVVTGQPTPAGTACQRFPNLC
jgi:uncharacterized membrane protein